MNSARNIFSSNPIQKESQLVNEKKESNSHGKTFNAYQEKRISAQIGHTGNGARSTSSFQSFYESIAKPFFNVAGATT